LLAFRAEDQPVRVAYPAGELLLFSREKRKRQRKIGWVLKPAPSPRVGARITAARALAIVRFPGGRDDPPFTHRALQVTKPFDQIADAPPSRHITHANRVVGYWMKAHCHIKSDCSSNPNLRGLLLTRRQIAWIKNRAVHGFLLAIDRAHLAVQVFV